MIASKPACPQSIPGGFSPLPNHRILSTLDAKQEALAKSIGGGHRIFFGVSGSGKTLLLISRAKMLVQQNSQARILVLCFNISLSSMLRSILDKASDNNQAIEVHHFHAWATEVVGKPINSKAGVNYDEYVGKQTLETLKSYPQQQKWDAILIDEAHTFIPIWFQCCVQALKDPENGDLMIVADGSQSIYKRSDFTWKSVRIKAQGRTISKKFDLDRNYRNTKEILTAAWNILQTGPKVAQNSDSDEITFPIVEPSQALRQGKLPQIYYLNSKSSLETIVAQKVKTQLDAGYNESEIAIIYRKASKQQLRQLQDELQKVGIEFFWVSKDQKSKANYSIEKPGIRLITTLSCLGLEFEVVLIPWMENFSDCSKRSEGALLARRELYVAMTRAKEEVHLFSSENNQFLQELDNSNYFEVTYIN
ncbi:MAG: 3'-5' exonuclease [Halothece sp. Uz-M2-17]|nr:3'-5' exonuclease [Halothece sp. Uz-M2-17]